MKAVFLKKFGAPEQAFEIRDAAIPTCAPDQVLIKVEAFGLNFADVLARTGMYPETPDRPCIIGYEVVGRVEAQGDKVTGDFVGTRVVALTRFGGYAEYAVTDYRAIGSFSGQYPAEKALAVATQFTTAYVCFHESMNLYRGDRVLIHAAAGGVGIALCQMALNAGCEIFATAGSEKKLEFLRNMGVHHTINYRENDYFKEINSLLKGQRIDATFNSLAGKSIKKDLRLLGAGGKLVLFGAASRVGGGKGIFSGLKLLFQTGFYTPLAFIMRSKSLIGINILKLGDYKPELIAKCLKAVIAQAEDGKLDPVVQKTYKIGDLNTAHLALEKRGTIGKTVVFW
ncbi:zinc-binding dehydrogenase [Cryomorpha ignava]|uniref:Zinc-binding dehydrogenase n=1 Tax=Cryomorpha ignava TaxID=101383 RepID=A0A7K3WPD2_9FLAO|nr:zinc-binding dehydrogenase [Cryomorpha ignava]NEN23510.1 zinc-binding dehydrogenase [Cryomorpha ignava]